jgi:hypothetical protein
MAKKEFETTDEPLCMIVSLDPITGKVLYMFRQRKHKNL